MAFTPAPTVNIAKEDGDFPTAAIVVIAVGGYLILFVIGLIIRKCIFTKERSCCPSWCSEMCSCESCCNSPAEEPGCVTKFAEICNWSIPSRKSCLDSCCPTKEWCDDTFCFCMSKQPHGECCKCDDCACGECVDCCDCPECKECCDECKCECCAQPETIDCCCLEVKLSGSNNPPQGSINQHGGYTSQGGYMMNQGGSNHSQNINSTINQQPVYAQQLFGSESHWGLQGGFNPGTSGSFQPGQLGSDPPGQSGTFQQGRSSYPGQMMNQQPVSFNQPRSSSTIGNQQFSSGMSGRPSLNSSLNNMAGSMNTASGKMFEAHPENEIT